MTDAAFHHMLHMGSSSKRIANIKPYYQTGWRETRLDLMADCEPDIVCDVMDMRAIPSGAYQSVYSSHNIEHVYAYQARHVLKDTRRLLADGGFALIRTPDMQKIAKIFAEQGPDAVLYTSPAGPITAHDTLYGKDSILEDGRHYMAHKCGFSAQALCDTLVASGFGRVHVQRKGFELLALAFTHRIPPDSPFSFKDFDLSLGLPVWVDDYYHFVQSVQRKLPQ
jgi:hypothetical protein